MCMTEGLTIAQWQTSKVGKSLIDRVGTRKLTVTPKDE
jgi:hypothetical protein